jgi:S-layer protein (TIGR01564 family)
MFDVEDKNENIGDGRTFNLTMSSSSGSDNEASITLDGTSDGNIIVNDKRETGRNTDIYEAYFNDTVSAKILEDQTDSDAKEITILYAGEETYGEIYIAAEGTVVTPGASASTTTVAGKIDVSATKLASEISDVTAQNLVLVGGPCANTAAAEVMGNPADCVAGFEAGKGLIQLFDDTGAGNVAILVAGMNAEDTRAAAMVLAEYDKYATDLDGKTKVEVSTATSTVTEVVDMPEEETMEDTTTV